MHYYSGVEGYCKAIARLALERLEAVTSLALDDPSAQGATARADLKGQSTEIVCTLINELFGHRVLDGDDERYVTISRTWTLSPGTSGGGRSNRANVFECQWLASAEDARAREAACREVERACAQGTKDDVKAAKAALAVIRKDIKRKVGADGAADKDERAVRACVASLLAKLDSIDAFEDCSSICDLARSSDDLALDLRAHVLRAMTAGFGAERYARSETSTFLRDMEDFLQASDFGQNEDGSLRDCGAIQTLVTRLVAAAIYGPAHPLALSDTRQGTFEYDEAKGRPFGQQAFLAEGDSLIISQIFDSDLAYIGHSEKYESNTVILFGRGNSADEFRERCALCCPDIENPLTSNETDGAPGSHTVIFPIPEANGYVSSAHGLACCMDGSWYYYDLGSKNGTVYESEGDLVKTEPGAPLLLRPGDRLHLGLSFKDAGPAGMFTRAATLLISTPVSYAAVE